MKSCNSYFAAFGFVLGVMATTVSAGAEELRIGTASQGGAFYPVGQAISTLVNEHADGLTMVPVVTQGSVQNPRLVNKGEIDVGITNNNLAVLANKGAAMYKKGGKMNLRALGSLHFSVLHMMTLEDSSIDSIADLKGLKIRCSPTHIEFLKKVGAQPMVIPPPDVHTAVERGVVDGFVWVAGLIRDWGWNEVVKYRVEPGFYMANNVVLINKEVWDKLPANLQKILRESEIMAEKAAVNRGKAHVAKENAIMEKGGMKLIKLSPAESKKLKDTANEALWEVVIKKSGDDGKRLKGLISR